MNFKTTIVLLVILAGVGLWIYMDQQGATDHGAQSASTVENGVEGRPLFTMAAEDVVKMTITPAQGKAITFHKDGAKWRIEAPIKAPAEAWEVDGLVRDLVGLRSRGQVAADASTGLDHAGYRITIENKDGQSLKLDVGNKTAIGDAMYVRINGQKKAEVAQADAYATLLKPLDDFRDKHLVEVAATNIKQLTVDRPGKEKLVLMKEGAHWRMTAPKAMPADDSAVSDLLFAIAGAQAVEYVPAEEAKPAMTRLDRPQASIWYSTAPPSTRPSTQAATRPSGTTILLGGYDTILKENVYATVAGSDSVVKLPVSTLHTFEKTPLELRDKDVLDIQTADVRSFTLSEDRAATTQPTKQPAMNKTISVERRATELTLGPAMPATHPAPTTIPASTRPTTARSPQSTWIISGTQTAADDHAVEELLDALHPLRAEKFVESQPLGGIVASYTITVHTADETPTVLRVVDHGAEQPLFGVHESLNFELDRALLTTLNDVLGHGVRK